MPAHSQVASCEKGGGWVDGLAAGVALADVTREAVEDSHYTRALMRVRYVR
jgi:hypothetical protein